MSVVLSFFIIFFFFNDTATTEIYTLSLHDALPICTRDAECTNSRRWDHLPKSDSTDRKSTRLNSSHTVISYAVFCLKKKKKHKSAFSIEKKKKKKKTKYYDNNKS